MVHRTEYFLLRLSEDMVNNPPSLTLLGCHYSDPDNRWFSGLVNQTVTASHQRDWTLNIVTYSWNAETTERAFRIKKALLPRLTDKVHCNYAVGADVTNGRVVFLLNVSGDNTCIVLDTV